MAVGSCQVATSARREIGRLLAAVARRIDRGAEPDGVPTPAPLRLDDWPAEPPPLAESVALFLPTAICLGRVGWEAAPLLLADYDHQTPSRFLASLYVAEQVREYPWGRIKVIASRVFLLPPAGSEDAVARGELMTRAGKGVPLGAATGFEPRRLTGILRPGEREIAAMLDPEEQLALVTVLAAGSGPAAFVSPGGRWPVHPLVRVLAHRHGCRLYRFDAGSVPESARRRLRVLRYEASAG